MSALESSEATRYIKIARRETKLLLVLRDNRVERLATVTIAPAFSLICLAHFRAAHFYES
ncbi:MAG: hypothetical protein DCF25_09300 [Leptolyngbya foveolarum]|uniref:Uncharacterized protein n=1 Tax=Leptolyngbya foveolarum TaxID=47253 RepID=A0A2W4UCT7_9CYAN|nr:MAG: hypothetical protein DCF25_09300 [Leptolyngbya foveolarum]